MAEILEGLCQCGCGQRTGIAKYTRSSAGWVKGKPRKYVRGHNSFGRIMSRESREKSRRSNLGQVRSEEACRNIQLASQKAWADEERRLRQSLRSQGYKPSLEVLIHQSVALTGREPIFSPFVPNVFVFWAERGNRWYAHPGKSRSITHGRCVWEYFNGPVPKGYAVHHKDGQTARLEDDRIENLMLLTKWWNGWGFPRLEGKWHVDTSVVTETYLKLVDHCEPDELYQAIDEELERITGVLEYE